MVVQIFARSTSPLVECIWVTPEDRWNQKAGYYYVIRNPENAISFYQGFSSDHSWYLKKDLFYQLGRVTKLILEKN